jgi:hypothetical protein
LVPPDLTPGAESLINDQHLPSSLGTHGSGRDTGRARANHSNVVVTGTVAFSDQ